MKRKKYLFNTLLLKYNKYKAKLLRFRLTGRNEHRQGVLEKHLERLQVKLYNLLASIKKAGAIAAISTAVVLAVPNTADAQAVFAGEQAGGGVTNPFGLTDFGYQTNVALVDFDGDGDLDLFSGERGGDFGYYENTAGAGNTPTFASPILNPFGISDINNNGTVEFVDIDGDGDLDLMSGHSDGQFHYFENTAGAGNTPAFAAPVINPFSLTDIGSYSNPGLVDFDGDGDIDLISGEYYGNFYYFRNIAGAGNTPSFAPVVTNPSGLSDVGYRSNVNLIDVDSDGDLDLMSGNSYGNFFYFENTAGSGNTPTFGAPVTDPFNLSDVGFYSNSELKDLDGDGDLDLMSGEYYGNFFYFENIAGAGNIPSFDNSLLLQLNPFGLSNLGYWSNSDIIDIDGDGDLDLMTGGYYGNFFYFENTAGSGNPQAFAAPVTNPFGLTDIGYRSKSNLIDLDGDGDLDLMSGDRYGDFFYFRNIAGPGNTPSFASFLINPFGLSNVGNDSSSDIVDLDGDGDLDLMSGEQDGSFNYFENTAGAGNTPTFAAPAINPFSLSNIGYTNNSDLVDLDADGDLDLMSGSYNGDFFYFQNTAGSGNTPIFASPLTNPFGLTDVGYLSNSNLIDIDGDGDLDLMSGESNTNLNYFENVTCTFDPLMAALDAQTDPLCSQQSTGSITLIASAATSPYTYSIDGGANSQTNGTFNSLAAGTFNVLVTDANGCETTVSTTLSEPDSIAVSSFSTTEESSTGAADGEITVVTEGGTGALDISWSPSGQTGATANGLSTGNYTVTVTDDNNCTFSESIFLDIASSINSLEVKDLTVYPNPTTGFITVSFEAMETKDVQFSMLNILGKTVLQESVLAVNGSFTKSFDLSNLATGVYLLQINSGEGTVTKKITVSK